MGDCWLTINQMSRGLSHANAINLRRVVSRCGVQDGVDVGLHYR